MTPYEWKRTLERADVTFAPGLRDSEIRAAEAAYAIRFPPDLEELLRYALPVGSAWPDWRNLSDSEIYKALNWPLEGILFDVEHNVFWLAEWGERPAELEHAFAVACAHVALAPKLIPVFAHRYVPQEPPSAGNPVFSVYQTDIIYYGSNLAEYFANEFPSHFHRSGSKYQISEPLVRIDFWSMLAENNY
jgi:hypothetical protein